MFDIDFPKEYCVYDFETTGFSPTENSVIQIGALRVAEGKVDFQMWYVRPKDWDGTIPEKITELTGIDAKTIKKHGIDEDVAFSEFAEFAKGLRLVGHNIVRFDNKFLGEMINAHGLEGFVSAEQCVDTAAMYKAMKMEESKYEGESDYQFFSRILNTIVPGLKYNLALCCEELKIDVSGLKAHTADADVKMTNMVLNKLMSL